MLQQRQQFLNYDKPKFVEDFIYTPPFEMMEKALKANQDGLQKAVDTAAILGTIDTRFIEDEKERERLAAIQDEINQKTTGLMDKIQGDPTRWHSVLPELTKLKQDLHKRYTTGDLYVMNKSAEEYEAMKESLAGYDAETAEAVEKYWMDNWRQNPERSDVFKWEKAYDKRDYASELETWLLARKDLLKTEADIKGRDGSWHRVGSTNNFISEEDLRQASAEFFNTPDWVSHFKDRERYNLDGGKFLDDAGRLIDPLSENSPLYDVINRGQHSWQNIQENIKSPYQIHLESLALRRAEFDFNKKQHLAQYNTGAMERGVDLQHVMSVLENRDATTEALNNVFSMLEKRGFEEIKKDFVEKNGTIEKFKTKRVFEQAQDMETFLHTVAQGNKEKGVPGNPYVMGLANGFSDMLETMVTSENSAWSNIGIDDPMEIVAAQKSENDAFRNGTQTRVTLGGGNFNGKTVKISDLKNVSRNVGPGVAGQEIKTVDGGVTGKFYEYYPAREAIFAYDISKNDIVEIDWKAIEKEEAEARIKEQERINKLSGRERKEEQDIFDGSGYLGQMKYLRAVIITPSMTENAIPTSKTSGTGMVDINLYGNTVSADGTKVVTSQNIVGSKPAGYSRVQNVEGSIRGSQAESKATDINKKRVY